LVNFKQIKFEIVDAKLSKYIIDQISKYYDWQTGRIVEEAILQ